MVSEGVVSWMSEGEKMMDELLEVEGKMIGEVW